MLEREIVEELAKSMNYRNRDGSYNKLRKTIIEPVEQIESDKLVSQNEERQLRVPEDIREIFDSAWAAKASDIHLSAGAPPKYRVVGSLQAVPGYKKLTPADLERLLSPLLNESQREQFEEEGDLDFAYTMRGVGRFRCNYYLQRGTWSAVFRLLSDTIPSIDTLGIPPAVANLIHKKRGLVLVTGPTGSGKSTTLAALINEINKTQRKNIITLEDPIEYTHKHGYSNVNQREIGSDSKSFASALRAALREDPDVILVGEMRDFETISTAITAAETGHLVFSTLHTIGAGATIDRILDTYPTNQQKQARSQLASVLEGVVSQQLIPQRNGSSRIAAFEVMLGSTAIKNNIREGHTEQISSTIQSSRKDGMILLDDCLKDLLKGNLITEEQALAFCVNPKYLKTQSIVDSGITGGNPLARRS